MGAFFATFSKKNCDFLKIVFFDYELQIVITITNFVFKKKCSHLNVLWIICRTFLESFETIKRLKFGSQFQELKDVKHPANVDSFYNG